VSGEVISEIDPLIGKVRRHMKRGRPRGTPQPPEARSKTAEASRRRWQDPAYRERMVKVLRANQAAAVAAAAPYRRAISAEERAKISKRMKALWVDPAYRERAAARLRANQPDACRKGGSAPKRKIIPEEGSAEYRLYRKLKAVLGAAAARKALGIEA
jgi:hypothetical protein